MLSNGLVVPGSFTVLVSHILKFHGFPLTTLGEWGQLYPFPPGRLQKMLMCGTFDQHCILYSFNISFHSKASFKKLEKNHFWLFVSDYYPINF